MYMYSCTCYLPSHLHYSYGGLLFGVKLIKFISHIIIIKFMTVTLIQNHKTKVYCYVTFDSFLLFLSVCLHLMYNIRS